MSSDALRSLFFDAPVFLALCLQRKAFLAGGVEFSVVRHVAVEGFKVGLPLFEGFDMLVHFAFDVVRGRVVEDVRVDEVGGVELKIRVVVDEEFLRWGCQGLFLLVGLFRHVNSSFSLGKHVWFRVF